MSVQLDPSILPSCLSYLPTYLPTGIPNTCGALRRYGFEKPSRTRLTLGLSGGGAGCGCIFARLTLGVFSACTV